MRGAGSLRPLGMPWQVLRLDYDSRKAVLTGNLAARAAGNNPPMKPMASAHLRPVHSRPGVTANSKTTWVNPDTHNNVGKSLPTGIKVIDFRGHSVDLHTLLQALHAPVMLLVVREKNCPPCDMLLTYARKHPELNAHGKTARLVVLRIMDSGHASLKLPANMVELHTPKWLHSGFLAHYIVPETFVFNRKLTLIERRTGVTSPEATLSYSGATSKGQVTTYQRN